MSRYAVVALSAFVLGCFIGRVHALNPGPSGYPSVCFEPARAR